MIQSEIHRFRLGQTIRQISKILEYPAPRAGEMIKLDAGVANESMEVVCRFPGGLDFGRGLVDVNVRSKVFIHLVRLRYD
jgi:hypothetical protein